MDLLAVLMRDCAKLDCDAFVAAHPEAVLLLEGLDKEPALEDAVTEVPDKAEEAERGRSPTPTPADMAESKREKLSRLVVSPLPSDIAQSPFRIGRASDNDLVLYDASVSSHHAMIHVEEEGLFLQDQGSKNGTKVEGKRIERDDRHQLKRSAVIHFGQLTCRFCEPAVLYEVLHLLSVD